MAEILADNSNLISAQILSIEPQDQHQPIAVACTTGKCTGGASYSVGGAAAPPTNWLLPHQLHGLPHQFSIYFEFLWFRNDHIDRKLCHDIIFLGFTS